MNRHNFKFTLTDEVIRGMTRQQYKAASHWIRYAARNIDQRLNGSNFLRHITDVYLYGQSDIRIEDLLI